MRSGGRTRRWLAQQCLNILDQSIKNGDELVGVSFRAKDFGETCCHDTSIAVVARASKKILEQFDARPKSALILRRHVAEAVAEELLKVSWVHTVKFRLYRIPSRWRYDWSDLVVPGNLDEFFKG